MGSIFEVIKRQVREDPTGFLESVTLDGNEGALMTWKSFVESVECGMFIDYDGFGDVIDEEGGRVASISPSGVSKFEEHLAKIGKSKDDVFVLWYNK